MMTDLRGFDSGALKDRNCFRPLEIIELAVDWSTEHSTPQVTLGTLALLFVSNEPHKRISHSMATYGNVFPVV